MRVGARKEEGGQWDDPRAPGSGMTRGLPARARDGATADDNKPAAHRRKITSARASGLRPSSWGDKAMKVEGEENRLRVPVCRSLGSLRTGTYRVWASLAAKDC